MSQQMHPHLFVRSWGTLGNASEGPLSWQEGKKRQDPTGSNSGQALGAKPNSEHRQRRPGKGFAKFCVYVRAQEKTTCDLSETAWRPLS